MRQGNFATLRNWLRQTIYQYGSIFTTRELVERAGEEGVVIGPYLEYLREKYSHWYDL
jgi:carboxypeptidase Taq